MASRKPKPDPTPGERMVSEILAEMLAAGVEPDAKETALLVTARQIVDRLDKLESIIETDGEIVTGLGGIVKVHPAISEHRQLAATLPKVLVGIVIGDTAAGGAKDPTKQRAANARWDRVARQRETVAARAAGE